VAKNDPDVTNYRFSDARDSIRDRALHAGLPVALERWSYGEDDPDPYLLVVSLSNGRDKRSFSIGEPQAEDFEAIAFENLKILGDYRAIYDPTSLTVEALLDAPVRILPRSFIENAGGEILEEDQQTGTVVEIIGTPDNLRTRLNMPPEKPIWQMLHSRSQFSWRVKVANSPVPLDIEISPVSRLMRAILAWEDFRNGTRARRISLKIRNYDYKTHDEAVSSLEDYASSRKHSPLLSACGDGLM
jgi:hypothetical protein